jgi:hypothetical protein
VVESNVTIRNIIGLASRRSCCKEVKAPLEICCGSNQNSGWGGGGGGGSADPVGK